MRYHPHAAIWWDHVGHSAAELEAQQDMYDGALAWLDSVLEELFDSLESRGLLENSVLIVTSDHGEAFGVHGRLGHGANVYHELIHVPLIISFGDRTPAGRRIADEVTLADLPATILDLIDIEKHEVPGQSLATAWDPANPRVPTSPIIAYENTGSAMGSLILSGWHYIRATNGREELFDLDSDPGEQRDLAPDTTFAVRLAQMRVAMDSVLTISPAQRLGESSASTPADVALRKR
jgi:arylsulfatase A-like enzyme